MRSASVIVALAAIVVVSATTTTSKNYPLPASEYGQQSQYAPGPAYGQHTQYAPASAYGPQTQYAPAPAYGQQTQYAPAPQYGQPTQYAPAPQYGQPTQYAPAPQYGQQYPNAPYQSNPNVYATPAPAPVVDIAKQQYNQFWTNTNRCQSRFSLRKCLLSCNGKSDFFNKDRVENCFYEFTLGLCGKLTQGQTYYNGYTTVSTDNCYLNAYSDAILVHSELLEQLDRHVESNLVHFEWEGVLVHLSVHATRKAADCTTEALFIYMDQCAVQHFIEPKTESCLRQSLNSSNCEYALEGGDRYDIARDIREGGVRGRKKLIRHIRSTYGDENHNAAYESIIDQWTAEEKLKGQIELDFSVADKTVAKEICPITYLHLNELYQLFGFEGIPELLVGFHFPSTETVTHNGKEVALDPVTINEVRSISPHDRNATRNAVKPEDIENKCEDFYSASKNIYDLVKFDVGNWCFAIDGYYVQYLESGQQRKIYYKPSQVTADVQCFNTWWHSEQSCAAHMSRWNMKVQCCKSYLTVQNELYSNSYSRRALASLAEPEPETRTLQRATRPASERDPTSLLFHKTVASSSQYGTLHIGAENAEHNGTLIVKRVTEYFNTLLQQFQEPSSADQLGNSPLERYCRSNSGGSINIARNGRGRRSNYYIGNHPKSVNTCHRLNIKVNFDEVVPIVTKQCYPEACVLSQLAACLDAPAPTAYGYNPAPIYDAPRGYGYQTVPGKQGYGTPDVQYSPYGNTPGYYGGRRAVALLAVPSKTSMSFAVVGLIAGVVVVAAIQATISRRARIVGNDASVLLL